MSEITRILSQIEQGDPNASDQLLPLVYDELRKVAAAKLAHEKPGQTLQATALVHEAYIRLVDNETPQRWDRRGHFFAAAAEAMRRILIENARKMHALRRGGSAQRLSIDLTEPVSTERTDDLLALDDALCRLEELDRRKAQLVKLRYFAGLTIPQAAAAIGVSVTTANRYWAYARAWLHEEIRNVDDNSDE